MTIEGEEVEITLHDVEITTEDIPGWLICIERQPDGGTRHQYYR